MFTYYLIKVAWGGDACIWARVVINLMLQGCQILCCGVAKYYVAGLPNIREVLLRNFYKYSCLFFNKKNCRNTGTPIFPIRWWIEIISHLFQKNIEKASNISCSSIDDDAMVRPSHSTLWAIQIIRHLICGGVR